jgi:Protein of unknown function (DUF3300)
MMKQLLRIALCGCILSGTAPTGSYVTHAHAETTEPQEFNAEQLDALLAPIALYPDPLLAQVLMASTFPLEVVTAARWIEEPAHKSLSGDALAEAVEPQTWDPSVKSLVPFPSVLALLNSNLDWTQQLGYAFADQQAAVMDSVQRLRFQAQSAGNLQTTEQQIVHTEQQIVHTEQQVIIIEPAQPNVVYVPSYNPTIVYGAWPYPAYPAVYLPPPPGYAFGAALVSGMAFAAGVVVVGSLWGWAQPGWGGGHVNVNVNRYNSINVNRTHINSNVWQPNRPARRPAGLQRPNGPVGRPARPNGLPANAVGRPNVNVPASAVNRPPRPNTGQANPANRPTGNTGNRVNPGKRTGDRPRGNAAVSAGAGARSPGQRPAPARQPEAFRGMERGREAAQFGARG